MIESILPQYAEEAAFLWLLRDRAIARPDYLLEELMELDERLDAQLDGLREGGPAGWKTCKQALLDIGEVGEVFTAAVLACEDGNDKSIRLIFKAGLASPEVGCGLVSALGWLPGAQASGPIQALLAAEAAPARRAGIAALAIRRQRPADSSLADALGDPDLPLRARALRAVGELGAVDLLGAVRPAFKDEDPACRFWAAWSAALLGRDKDALQILRTLVMEGGPLAGRAALLVMRADDPNVSHRLLQRLRDREEQRRLTVIAAGALGDPDLVPWLIEQMALLPLARVAGEAFSTITGADLVNERLECETKPEYDAGPTENPEDENVEMDPDEDLPWPDPARVQAWWEKNKGRYPRGPRYLVGQAIAEASLKQVLRTGLQRQRAAAAIELALRQPEKGLFEVRAPGFRQQQWLAAPQ